MPHKFHASLIEKELLLLNVDSIDLSLELSNILNQVSFARILAFGNIELTEVEALAQLVKPTLTAPTQCAYPITKIDG